MGYTAITVMQVSGCQKNVVKESILNPILIIKKVIVVLSVVVAQKVAVELI